MKLPIGAIDPASLATAKSMGIEHVREFFENNFVAVDFMLGWACAFLVDGRLYLPPETHLAGSIILKLGRLEDFDDWCGELKLRIVLPGPQDHFN